MRKQPRCGGGRNSSDGSPREGSRSVRRSCKRRSVALGLLVVALVLLPGPARWFGGSAEGADVRRLNVEAAVKLAQRRNPYVEMAEARKERARIMWEQAEEAARKAEAISGGAPIAYEIAVMPFQAKTGYNIAKKAFEAAQAGVGLGAEAAYYGVLKAEGMLEVAEEAVKRGKDQVNLAKKMRDAGLVASKDVIDAEVRLAEMEANLASAKKYRELARLGFLKTLGLGFDEAFELTDKEIPFVRFKEVDDEDLPKKVEEALKNRFEVYQAERTLDLKEIELDLIGEHPFMDLSADRVYAEAAAEEAVDEARAALAAQKAEVEYSVREAFLSIREAEERVDLAARAVEQAEEALRLAKLRYSAGLSTSLEVMGAELALTQAENARLQAIFDHNLAKANFKTACGVGTGGIGAPAGTAGMPGMAGVTGMSGMTERD